MLIQGDCIEVLKTLDENSVDAIVTDPPYELGFMGKGWDKTGIANNVDMWKECLRVLKPGGHLLSFGGTRTYHRMASAIEDAGFEIRDMIEWIYGSGFPKSLNIGKAVDKLQGNEREETHKETKADSTYHTQNVGGKITGTSTYSVTKGTSEWEGWGTALKPAHEPICMARKPLAEKTVAENVLKYGTGGINIDESRVGTEGITTNGKGKQDGNTPIVPQSPDFVGETHTGRFPANLIHDGSDEVVGLFPNSKSVASKRGGATNGNGKNIDYGDFNEVEKYECGFSDSGNASRFFKSIIYTAKASKSERNRGCEDLDEQITSDGRDKSIDNAFQRGETLRHNNHPTVKPIALMEYLINMVTKEGQTVLDPFTGSGTTLIAAKKLGRKYIGIELEPEYVKIAEERLRGTTPSMFNKPSTSSIGKEER